MVDDFPVLSFNADDEELLEMMAIYSTWNYEVAVVVRHDRGGSAEAIRQNGDTGMLVSALREMPPLRRSSSSRNMLQDAVVPLQVSPHTTVKALLSLMSSMEKSIAFVTRDGRLVGAVTISALHSRASQRQEESIVEFRQFAALAARWRSRKARDPDTTAS